ncbi:hypothetical protein SPRG_09963 [Saprolegnia parasitica CBS 223.65]|uniref:AB hydrolase-1 domain-containing protein n=1 Tax=Saprolegnia parasitica (strain CBS 223.65) TaxID=695850 RepID=A0A067C213_SAPPC|nr:hypothetical protein SPRG_09963 [Saprolegnia parasitica CBS 223.65]KDO23155.1 hypothetical protein SPRG_09963 [Saprolegnia parasitica CBS 223.65]|eukprot:XP_012206107.1 hypothetical protein SPRG_09963 [Saprolegnia parasitica CBS 223.65]
MASVLASDAYNKVARLANGRQVSYADVGDGFPVVCLVGMHGHRHYAYLFHALAAKHGVRFLCIDRPGYGLSDPSDDATPVPIAFAHILHELLDMLRIPTFGLMGQSAGALFALGIAANDALKDRIAGAVVLLAPWVGVEKSPFLLKLASCCPNALLSAGVGCLSASMDVSMSYLGANTSVPVLCAHETDDIDESDETSPVMPRHVCLGDLRATISTEPQNAIGDVLLCLGRDPRGVGYDATTITAHVHVVHGEKDAMVPVAAVLDFVAAMANATLELVPDATHSNLGLNEPAMDRVFAQYSRAP